MERTVSLSVSLSAIRNVFFLNISHFCTNFLLINLLFNAYSHLYEKNYRTDVETLKKEYCAFTLSPLPFPTKKILCMAVSEHLESAGVHSGDATLILSSLITFLFSSYLFPPKKVSCLPGTIVPTPGDRVQLARFPFIPLHLENSGLRLHRRRDSSHRGCGSQAQRRRHRRHRKSRRQMPAVLFRQATWRGRYAG